MMFKVTCLVLAALVETCYCINGTLGSAGGYNIGGAAGLDLSDIFGGNKKGTEDNKPQNPAPIAPSQQPGYPPYYAPYPYPAGISPPYGGGVPSYGGGVPSYGGGVPPYGGGVPPYSGGGVPSYGGGVPPNGGGVPPYGGGVQYAGYPYGG